MSKVQHHLEFIIIGGSWGGMDAVITILSRIPANFPVPILIVLHRLRNVSSELGKIIQSKTKLKLREIEDKDKIRAGTIYLAPVNYHVLIEKDKTFSLDTSERINYSRPSIDVAFESAADVYGEQLLGMVLSGANKDGSFGLKCIKDKGGITIVQNPSEAEINTMPLSALEMVPDALSLKLMEFQDYLLVKAPDMKRENT